MTMGSDANYDIYYRNSSGVLTRLPAGADGNVLTTHSTTSAPTWSAAGGSGVTSIGTINSQTKSANGAVISGSSLVMQTADASYPGLMTSTQYSFLDSLKTHNSYVQIDKRSSYDSLAFKKNDSTLRIKSISLIAGTNISSIAKTVTDTSLAYTINASGGNPDLSWNSGTHAVDISGGGTSSTIPYTTFTADGLMSSAYYKRLDSNKTESPSTGTWTIDVNDGRKRFVNLTTTGYRKMSFSNLDTRDVMIFNINNSSGSDITDSLPADSYLNGVAASAYTIPTGRSTLTLTGYDGTSYLFNSSDQSNTTNTLTTKTVKLGSDYTNATTTGTSITGLKVSSTGTGIVKFEFDLLVQSSATTTGWKFGINHTGTASVLAINMTYPSTGTTAATGIGEDIVANNTGSLYEASASTSLSTTSPNLGPTAGVAATGTNVLVKVFGLLNVTASGDLEIWAGAENSNTITVKANSIGIVNIL